MKSILFVFLSVAACVFALPLELGAPFSENMVLQRESRIPVWGWAAPSTEVTVTVADKKETTIVSEDGTWKLELDVLPTGGPYRFEVAAGEEKITYSNVLVGDVWICSGQSNMQMGYGQMIGNKQILTGAKGRPIRCLNVKRDVSFTPNPRCSGTWSTGPVPSAVALAFSYHLQKSLDVPVGIILTCWGSSSIEGWMPKEMVQELPHFKQIMSDFEQNDTARVRSLIEMRDQGKNWPLKDNIFLRTRPNLLYNAMMYPLIPYAVRGIVWYQGEANAKTLDDMLQYGQSMQAWCKKLRAIWQRDDLQLLAVMLPGFGKWLADGESITDPSTQSWAWMRQSQLQILDLPNTGVVNTVDLGDANNIHPRDKEPIGRRLALLATPEANRTGMVQGPKMKSVMIKTGEVVFAFENAEGLTTTDGKPVRGFWVAGKDRQWKAVAGRIDGQTVMLDCGNVTPEAVRYAFCAVPDVNLVNAAGLPALPFRTDKDKP